MCTSFKTCFSEEVLDQLARKTKFIKRKGILDAKTFVKLLIFNTLDQSQLSLLDLKLDLQSHFDCNISREAIHKRFTPEAVDFLKALLARLLELQLKSGNNFSSPAKAFNRLCLKDSTKFSIPKEFSETYPSYGNFHKQGALMNIQYEYDLLSGNWTSFEFTKATRNDQKDSRETLDNIDKNDLHIRDLGYVTMIYLEGVVEREAYFLNRLPTTINVYGLKNNEYHRLNWKSIDKAFKNKGMDQMELDVVLSKKYKLGSRMIIIPIPNDVYKERIRKAAKQAKSKGCQLTNEYKIKARYNIFITNVPADRLCVQDVAQVYRLRWQVELVFKSWKSGLAVHKTKRVQKNRFECQLIARIIWALINWRLYQSANLATRAAKPDTGVSILKFNKQTNKHALILREIIEDASRLKNWVKEKIIPLLPYLLIEKKKGKTPHCEILSRNIWKLS
ncbi:IS4 family transposase [uncultured Draconibacterium sp.]|uniref:IS4 family transposase n=1 Tax=uncultured Draconibacterium sp. TaxID=1573823 RepID=UPI003216ACC3